MIYTGLEFGTFFETPVSSISCYNVLRGVNPVLQMVFTFMQMYFIFMNSRVRDYYSFNPYGLQFCLQISEIHFYFTAQHSPFQSNCSFWFNAHCGHKHLCLDPHFDA